MRRLAAAVVLALLAQPAAHAAVFTYVDYDHSSDELVLEIAYRGTNPRHLFSLEWGECSESRPYQTVARVIDSQWRDLAERDYRVWRRFSLAGLACRPALVTLRIGRVAHASIYVPEAPCKDGAGKPRRCQRREASLSRR